MTESQNSPTEKGGERVNQSIVKRGLFDEEDGVCSGCGRLFESEEHDWCPNCAPELYRP